MASSGEFENELFQEIKSAALRIASSSAFAASPLSKNFDEKKLVDILQALSLDQDSTVLTDFFKRKTNNCLKDLKEIAIHSTKKRYDPSNTEHKQDQTQQIKIKPEFVDVWCRIHDIKPSLVSYVMQPTLPLEIKRLVKKHIAPDASLISKSGKVTQTALQNNLLKEFLHLIWNYNSNQNPKQVVDSTSSATENNNTQIIPHRMLVIDLLCSFENGRTMTLFELKDWLDHQEFTQMDSQFHAEIDWEEKLRTATTNEEKDVLLAIQYIQNTIRPSMQFTAQTSHQTIDLFFNSLFKSMFMANLRAAKDIHRFVPGLQNKSSPLNAYGNPFSENPLLQMNSNQQERLKTHFASMILTLDKLLLPTLGKELCFFLMMNVRDWFSLEEAMKSYVFSRSHFYKLLEDPAFVQMFIQQSGNLREKINVNEPGMPISYIPFQLLCLPSY